MEEGGKAPDVYLVVIDGTPECRRALRYGALRAARTGGRLRLVHAIAPQQFLQWGQIQADMEAEAQEEAERLLDAAAREAERIAACPVETSIRHGRPSEAVFAAVREDPAVRALVLAAAARGRPGPLVEYFAGEKAAALPCIVSIIPGGLSDEALDRLA